MEGATKLRAELEHSFQDLDNPDRRTRYEVGRKQRECTDVVPVRMTQEEVNLEFLRILLGRTVKHLQPEIPDS